MHVKWEWSSRIEKKKYLRVVLTTRGLVQKSKYNNPKVTLTQAWAETKCCLWDLEIWHTVQKLFLALSIDEIELPGT